MHDCVIWDDIYSSTDLILTSVSFGQDRDMSNPRNSSSKSILDKSALNDYLCDSYILSVDYPQTLMLCNS